MAGGTLGRLPSFDLVNGSAKVARLLMEKALEVIPHRHTELRVHPIVPLLEPRV